MARAAIVSMACWLAVLAGCADLVGPPALDLSMVDMPIVGGVAPDAPRHNAVVGLLVTKRGGSFLCTGTLIRDRWVATAAHCLWDRRNPVAPSAVVVYIGNSISGGFGRPVNGVFVHSGYIDSANSVNDVALLRLASAVPACTGTGLTFPACADPVRELAPALALNAGDIGVADGLDFAGFGRTSANGPSGIKLHAYGELGGFGCVVAGCSGLGNPATQFSYAQTLDGPCFGDSGGAAFIQRNGTWYDAGPTSTGDNNCTLWGVSMRWDAYGAFISSVIGCSTAADCSDGNACTTDACEAGVCQYTPLTCSDGDPCTVDACVAGACDWSTPTDCDDDEVCTTDSCVAVEGCHYDDAPGPCSDGNDCTLEDSCGGGLCISGAPSPAPECNCAPLNATCNTNSQCCSGRCLGHRCRP